MRVGRYLTKNAGPMPFVAYDDGIVPWNRLAAVKALRSELRHLLLAAVRTAGSEAFCRVLPHLAALPADFRPPGELPLPSQLLPPIAVRNLICVGLNYREHAAESASAPPEAPLLFAKSVSALSGHGQPIRLPPGSTQVDYEAELAVIMGRTCRRVAAKRALEYVAGYTCANDVSARDFQFQDGQWFRGKSADTFGPLGPWLVTPEAVGDPQALDIQLRLNGELLQSSNTRHMMFSIPRLIEYISRTMTLQAGDAILTGTPPGVGFARQPPVYLRAGDRVEVEIARVGRLENPVIASPPPGAITV